MKKLIFVILSMISLSAHAQSYYQVDVLFKLTDGSEQSSSLQSLKSYNYDAILAELTNYVKPYKIQPYSLVCLMKKVNGKMQNGDAGKFNPNPAPKKPKAIKRRKIKYIKPYRTHKNNYYNQVSRYGISAMTNRSFILDGTTAFMPKTIVKQTFTGEATLPKDDSIITAKNTRFRQPQSFMWIDYPKDGYPFYTVRFAKSTVTFINDSTFTFVEKFK